MFVYRRNGTRFEDGHVQIYDRSGRKSIPVWSCFYSGGPGPFVKIEGRFVKEKYLSILNDHLLPWIREKFGDNEVKFIHDHSPIHKANVVKSWFEDHPQIRVLPWPPKGADLNPIENVWGHIVTDDRYNGRNAANADAVFNLAKNIWTDKPVPYWKKLSESMVNRLHLCLQAEGKWTKY